VSDRILVCYDGSGPARTAIETAATVVAVRRAVVLNVGEPLTRSEASQLMTRGALDLEHVNAPAARELAEEGAEIARRAGFDTEVTGGVATPVWEAIVRYAEIVDAALIVMGSRAGNHRGEAFKASTPGRVARHAGRPVLVVPEPPAAA
jgi:nucleotide-binding universal stress UspA family protein